MNETPDYETEARAWAEDQAERHGHDPDAIMAMLRERGYPEWEVQVGSKIDLWADEDVTLIVAVPPTHGRASGHDR